MRFAAVYAHVSTWAQAAALGSYSSTSAALSEDVDLDGEPEHLLFNDRVFTVIEAIGGRMTGAWVRDLTSGDVRQVIGNPWSYSGFDTEEEGIANVVSGAVGAYRTSAFKDAWAAGPNTVMYVNDLYTVASVPGGWRFTSSDGKVQKTLTLGTRANAVTASYTLHPSITTL